MNRTVLIVAPEFPPCNLTAGHRTRLFVRHLNKFGYDAIVLTVNPEEYETTLDMELNNLVSPEVEIIRTRAIPVKPIRFFGDLGLRSILFHIQKVIEIHKTRKIDLIYIPMPSYYSSLLGPFIKFFLRIPYVIDYIDPWVYKPTPDQWKSPKSMITHVLSRVLEPVALTGVSGITGVAEGYYADVMRKHPRLKTKPSLAVPYGGEINDHLYVRETQRQSKILSQPQFMGKKVFVYAGAVLPRAHGVLRQLFLSFKAWRENNPDKANEVHLLFIGTGKKHNDPNSGIVVNIARDAGVLDFVTEIAERQPFIEVLATLEKSHAVMIIGSTDSFYTASKTFQSLHSMRPILALLHAQSTAADILRSSSGVALVTFDEQNTVETKPREIDEAITRICQYSNQAVTRDLSVLNNYSAEKVTEKLAAMFDEVLKK